MAQSKAAAPEQKTNKIATFFKGMAAELKKVYWPTKKELAVYTVVVLITVAIATILLYFVDLGFSAALTKILGL